MALPSYAEAGGDIESQVSSRGSRPSKRTTLICISAIVGLALVFVRREDATTEPFRRTVQQNHYKSLVARQILHQNALALLNEQLADAETHKHVDKNALSPAKRAEIAAKMKALRESIDSDFSSMTHYGKAVGYLPPPQNIRQQAMSGELFKSPDIPVPPPFNADAIVVPPIEVPVTAPAPAKAPPPAPAAANSPHTAEPEHAEEPAATAPPAMHADAAPGTHAAGAEAISAATTVSAAATAAKAATPVAATTVSAAALTAAFTDPPLFVTAPPLAPPTRRPIVSAAPPPAAVEHEEKTPAQKAWAAAFSFMKDRHLDVAHSGDAGSGESDDDTNEPPAVRGEQKYFLKAMHEDSSEANSNSPPTVAVVKHSSTEKAQPVWKTDNFLKGYFR